MYPDENPHLKLLSLSPLGETGKGVNSSPETGKGVFCNKELLITFEL
jgi:hypothetical protein